ncbi:MAG: Sec-independent protein translocase subunit TatC, sec-independent protein translocase protein TatC [Chloroflexi bacterium CSP1-4]|nr:MAG: Sec-independent protein translocase subunit TatC, sec-independent protein translocase protein TatC [Chloroflexi bacterium CSP1-4]
MAEIEVERQAESGLPVVVNPPPSVVEDKPESGVMTLVDHLVELRRRIFIGVLALVIGSVIGFVISDRVLEILRAPIGDQKLIYLELGGAFAIRLKLGVLVGVALAFPVIAWQLWAFVAPGLTAHERRVARPWVPLMVVFFLLGVGVAYAVLPAAASFLRSFEIPGVLESTLTAEAYFGFVTMLFLAFGAVMQFPIVIVVLNRIGLLSVERLKGSRRYVILGIVIFAVVVTPGGDPVSPLVMSAVMYGLYELTILVLGRTARRAPATDA